MKIRGTYVSGDESDVARHEHRRAREKLEELFGRAEQVVAVCRRDLAAAQKQLDAAIYAMQQARAKLREHDEKLPKLTGSEE